MPPIRRPTVIGDREEWFEKRRNSIDTSVVFGRANTPISLAPRALSMRQRRVHFAFGVHSAPRSQDNAGSIANSDNQHRLEYALIISGEGMKHMNKTFITRIIQQKYPAITDFHWSHQRSLEMTSIRRKFHIHGTFVKILFANPRERLRAHTFVKPFILGGKMVKINEYTSRKPTPAAPSSSPATTVTDLSELMVMMFIGRSSTPQQNSDVVMEEANPAIN
ncbi:hypothetical protein L207DRAFT_583521 [Hyaloscypha variabilis F]|uniref:Uncharacterized protein n=1 Tax=Hyaloscypha variabilis (strain UAMH 11265 / GT02V1 / F) TaxID=1149755 RepID=A0A2J6RMC6_HYAVF|nr:hypothetical protein L207DRAFT_583521 [Hyaloscypha variabilis F]